MKIKDLPLTASLSGVYFRYPGDGQAYYWVSQWGKGIWAKTDRGSQTIYPLFVKSIKEALAWEVLPEPPAKPLRRTRKTK